MCVGCKPSTCLLDEAGCLEEVEDEPLSVAREGDQLDEEVAEACLLEAWCENVVNTGLFGGSR